VLVAAPLPVGDGDGVVDGLGVDVGDGDGVGVGVCEGVSDGAGDVGDVDVSGAEGDVLSPGVGPGVDPGVAEAQEVGDGVGVGVVLPAATDTIASSDCAEPAVLVRFAAGPLTSCPDDGHGDRCLEADVDVVVLELAATPEAPPGCCPPSAPPFPLAAPPPFPSAEERPVDRTEDPTWTIVCRTGGTAIATLPAKTRQVATRSTLAQAKPRPGRQPNKRRASS
jgi:hypothetical protein